MEREESATVAISICPWPSRRSSQLLGFSTSFLFCRQNVWLWGHACAHGHAASMSDGPIPRVLFFIFLRLRCCLFVRFPSLTLAAAVAACAGFRVACVFTLNVFRVSLVCVSLQKKKKNEADPVVKSVVSRCPRFLCNDFPFLRTTSRISTKPHCEPHVYCRTARWAMHRHRSHTFTEIHAALISPRVPQGAPKCSGRVISPTLHTVSPPEAGCGQAPPLEPGSSTHPRPSSFLPLAGLRKPRRH